MKTRKILAIAALLLVGAAAYAQNSASSKKVQEYAWEKYWFVGAGWGLNIGFDGNVFQNHFYRETSHRGPGWAGEIYFGKWFWPHFGARVGYQGFSVSDEFTTFGKYPFSYVHGDLLIKVFPALVPYIHAGYLQVKKGTFAGGPGVMFPIPVSPSVSIIPDVRYAFCGNKVFPEGDNVTSNLSVTLSVAYKFGGVKRQLVQEEEVPAVLVPMETPVKHDTVVVREVVKEPVVQKVVDTVVVDHSAKAKEFTEALHNVTLFDTDSYKISDEAKLKLDEVAEWMQKYPNLTAALEGHTDNVGRAAYNQTLSENRANAIRNYLISKGISASRLSAKGYGLTRPIDTNSTPEGRHRNRRVELSFSE